MTSALLARWRRRARRARVESRAGFASAANVGARAARGRLICFLSDGAVVTAGWLTTLLETIAREAAVAVASQVRAPDGTLVTAGGIFAGATARRASSDPAIFA